MITVKKIFWIDKDSGEVDVLLSDGRYLLECFSSDCKLFEGEVFSGIVHGFNVKNIFKSPVEKYSIEKKRDYFYIKGEFVDIENELLQVGEFKIDLSDANIPNDIKQNDYIEFELSRIDIY